MRRVGRRSPCRLPTFEVAEPVKSPFTWSASNVSVLPLVIVVSPPTSMYPMRGSAGVVGVSFQITQYRNGPMLPPDAVHEKSATTKLMGSFSSGIDAVRVSPPEVYPLAVESSLVASEIGRAHV